MRTHTACHTQVLIHTGLWLGFILNLRASPAPALVYLARSQGGEGPGQACRRHTVPGLCTAAPHPFPSQPFHLLLELRGPAHGLGVPLPLLPAVTTVPSSPRPSAKAAVLAWELGTWVQLAQPPTPWVTLGSGLSFLLCERES